MSNVKEEANLRAAYLCLKKSIHDDLYTMAELHKVLCYAGFNPTPNFLSKAWISGQTKSLTFEDYCSISKDLEVITEKAIREIISDTFILNGDSIFVKDIMKLVNVSHSQFSFTQHDILDLLDEIGVENGVVKIDDFSKVILNTILDMKQFSSDNLKESSAKKRLNSRVITKEETIKDKSNAMTFSSTNVRNWYNSSLKGSLFIDEDFIITHQYNLDISTSTATFINILLEKSDSTILTSDIQAYIFKDTLDGSKIFIGHTSSYSDDTSNYWSGSLNEGRYLIIPYTNGCIKRKPVTYEGGHIQLIVKSENGLELTPVCKRILRNIFSQMDLDGNNLLNRQEFNLYNWRSSGEVVQDDEWDIVQKNFDVLNGELTFEGFLALHKLEAEDNDGNSDELWASLETIGFNRWGYQEKCSPFNLSIYCQVSDPSLQVSGLKSGGILLDKAVIKSVIDSCSPILIDDKPNLFLYCLKSDKRSTIIVQNKSSEDIQLRIDCSESINAFSNRGNMIWEGTVERKSAVISHHLAPVNSAKPWEVKWQETLIKS